MKLYSTNDPALRANFRDAVFQGLAPDGGLFMPLELPPLPKTFWDKLSNMKPNEIAIAISQHLLADAIPQADLADIVKAAINFEAPLVPIEQGDDGVAENFVLELFHGPSLAFKDFGARFMAGIMNHFLGQQHERLLILVATSGDTGGAVAAGFHGSENIDVLILYPNGKVSDVQEAQLTTLGGNIRALRIDGTFDDCQALVKEAFVDEQLRSRVSISSANSINIARLIPQMFYYVDAYRQWLRKSHTSPPVFAVPSGNFGNLTAGVMAHQLGMPVAKFVAATNANDTVVAYAETGEYLPKASVQTLSNAMDVGAPSNYIRMSTLLGSTWNAFKEKVYAVSFTDDETEAEMQRGFRQNQPYIMDPHTAVASLGLRKFQRTESPLPGIVLSTAHPAKFSQDVNRILNIDIEMPEKLQQALSRPREVTDLTNNYATLRKIILSYTEK